MTLTITTPRCRGCGKTPCEIEEYVDAAREDVTTPDLWVHFNEGTYNHDAHLFTCTKCYIEMGMPSIGDIIAMDRKVMR